MYAGTSDIYIYVIVWSTWWRVVREQARTGGSSVQVIRLYRLFISSKGSSTDSVEVESPIP